MSKARLSLSEAASPAGSRISCCESAMTGTCMASPPGTVRPVAGPAGHSRTLGCRLGLPSLLHQPLVQSSALPPKRFSNPVTCFVSEASSQVPTARQPPPWPPAAIRLPQSVLLQAARGIFLKLQITSCHSPNLPLACGSSTSKQSPYPSLQPP